MKRPLGFVLCLFLLAVASPGQISSQRDAKNLEYAIVKWDGPDRLYYNLPDKFELVHLGRDRKVTIPKEAQPEEFCLAYAVNELAKIGWEAVNLNSRRVLLRRFKS